MDFFKVLVNMSFLKEVVNFIFFKVLVNLNFLKRWST